MPGRLITIEGLDGAGKTTLCSGLAQALPDARLLREPGGVELSERIRELVKDPALDVDPRAEALLYAAARAQLVSSLVRPLLEGGTTVLFADVRARWVEEDELAETRHLPDWRSHLDASSPNPPKSAQAESDDP